MRTTKRVANGINNSKVNATTVESQGIEHQNILSPRRRTNSENRDVTSNLSFVERITTPTNVHKRSRGQSRHTCLSE